MAQYKVIRQTRQLQTSEPCNCYQNDHVDLVVEGAGIRLCRLSNLSVPAEVSAYIPRVEIRHRRYENGQLICEDERIYNSITMVHAPRHPSENPSNPLELKPLPPSIPGNQTDNQPILDPAPAADDVSEKAEKKNDQANLKPPTPGLQPPPPKVPTAPGLEQPGAAKPPVIPSQPELHPPPVSPREAKLPFLPQPLRKERPSQPVITINKKRLDHQ
ncbi:hypothetical protein [Desulforamulus aeronauticus]|uniref:Uncharacterized protein n=1 Tax=Desulforamulus aeronauticus DSM 10349 TaxID=1121421 RepID=A0A1M6WXR0_9FIRM|nr:hypothetical protein [Desulforamulus aeronauticus]SHK98345.1 hypothetical protein SAMN02745123_03813 [Desulforamulus aeronauticus DSM 10349]